MESETVKLDPPLTTKSRIKDPIILLIQLVQLYVIFFTSIVISIIKYFLLLGQKSVKDKIVLITGAGGGLGRELSLEFAKLGSKVICVDVDSDSNVETVNKVNEIYPNSAKSYVANIGRKDDVARVSDEIENDYGRVDILINNAGIFTGGNFLDVNDITYESTINVNLVSQFRLIKRFLPGMIKRNEGHIVSVSNVLSLIGTQNGAAYVASSWGINGLLESLHEELRKIPDNQIKISCACPYFINTSLTYTKALQLRIPHIPLPIAVKSIVAGIRRNERLFTVPRFIYFYFIILKLLPDSLANRIKDVFYMALDKADAVVNEKSQVNKIIAESGF